MADEEERYFDRGWKRGDKVAYQRKNTYQPLGQRAAHFIDNGLTHERVFQCMLKVHGEKSLWDAYEKWKKENP